MRILNIENNRVIIEVDRTELDNIVNMVSEDQYRMGYGDGFDDYRRIHSADMDDDRSEDYPEKGDPGII